MLRFPDSGGVNGGAMWRRRWAPRSKGPAKIGAPDWTTEDAVRAEREIFAMCREAARRSAGGPQRARRRSRRSRDAEVLSPSLDVRTDFDGGTNTMSPRWRSMWPHFQQWNVNMAGVDDDAPKVKSFPWDKQRKAERAAAKKAESGAKGKGDKAQGGVSGKPPTAASKAAGGATAKSPGGPRQPAGATTKSPGGPGQPAGATAKSPESATTSQPKKTEDVTNPAAEQPPKSILVSPESAKQPKPQAETKPSQVDTQGRLGVSPYPVMSHYQMPMPAQFSYPYQLPITGQPIVMPGRPSSDFCHHCGRGSDGKTGRKGKKKEKALDMDTFLADVERKLAGKLQMQEMFMQELEEHYRDTLVTRSPPPCRRSHTDIEEETEDEDDEQSYLTEVDPNLQHHHQHTKQIHKKYRSHQHPRNHFHQFPAQQHKHQHKSETHFRRLEEEAAAKPDHDATHNLRCIRTEPDRQHPNRHAHPCRKPSRSERRSTPHRSQSRPHENRSSTSQCTATKKKSLYEKFARKSHRNVRTPSDETSSSASRRKAPSFEDSDTSSLKNSTSRRRSSKGRKSRGSYSKSNSVHSSEDRDSKYRSQLEIVTSQLPFRERNALKKSLASLRARKEDKELERQLELLERELFAGEENVEWEQQLSLDTPTGRLKMEKLEAKEDRVLDALFEEQDGFSEEDVMSEPEPLRFIDAIVK